jgi:hypothetical protein
VRLERHIQGFYLSMDLSSKCVFCCPVARIRRPGKSLRKECRGYLLRTGNRICEIIQPFGVGRIGLGQQRLLEEGKIPDRQGNREEVKYPSQKYEY